MRRTGETKQGQIVKRDRKPSKRPLRDPSSATPAHESTATASTAQPDPWSEFASMGWRDADVHAAMLRRAANDAAARGVHYTPAEPTPEQLEHAHVLLVFVFSAVTTGAAMGARDPWAQVDRMHAVLMGRRYERAARIATILDDARHPERAPRLEVSEELGALYSRLLEGVRVWIADEHAAHGKRKGVAPAKCAAILDRPKANAKLQEAEADAYRSAWTAMRDRFEAA